jgi:predicted MFS family arabinose efflux permease
MKKTQTTINARFTPGVHCVLRCFSLSLAASCAAVSRIWSSDASMLVCAGLFFVGALICAVAPHVAVMTIGRIILGFGVGVAAATCPPYLAEMALVHRRGRMVTTNALVIVTGSS